MPKGVTKYTKYEMALLKANRDIQKATKRLEAAAAELAGRPDPTPAPKAKASAPVKQLKLPGTTAGRKAAKAPAQPRKSRARRS